MTLELWKHQIEGIRRATEVYAKGGKGYAFLFQAGTGKTRTTIDVIRNIYNLEKRIKRTLIFCPNIVTPNWREEWLKYSKIEPRTITCLLGSGKERQKLFEKRSPDPKGHIFIMNYETLLMKDLFPLLHKWLPEVVVADEIHLCKSHSSKRSKALDQLVNRNTIRPFCIGLSGTISLNNQMDIFQPFKILDGGDTFGENYFGFRGRYFRDKNSTMPKWKYFPNWQIKDGAAQEIGEKMGAISMCVLKKDCLDLPPFVQQTLKIPMSPKQRKLYDSMLSDFVAFWRDADGKEHAASATLALTKGLRLQQIASGYVKTTEDEEVELDEGWCPKQEALSELLEQLTDNHKVIVWAVWKKNYQQIKDVCNKLKLKFVEVHGDIPNKQKYINVDEFNLDSSCKVFIGHPGSGGIGLNLIPAAYSIFYSRTFSLGESLQAEARNYRGGSEIHEKVTRIDLVSENSIEEKILEALLRKENISAELLKKITNKE